MRHTPEFVAVEDVAVTLLRRGRLHAHDVATGSRLGHGQSANLGASNEVGEIPGLLGGSAVSTDLVDAEVGVGAVAEGQRTRRAG